jgi:hypothetical protein
MELAGKYSNQVMPSSRGPGPGVNMSSEQLEKAIGLLIRQGYTFEDAMVSLMAGTDLRGLRK